MDEVHEATIQWRGNSRIAEQIIHASNQPHCEFFTQEENGEMFVSVTVQHSNLQELRDIVDALLIQFAEIEEGG
ncbi:MAG: hypothetical protein QF364_00040 [Candidatus Poseidoniaceae archaeon]|jgi:formyltetrahydrofolate hydrolase|nr:hypothetical protein [Candidatus Poseidoniaceae archaeon]